MHRWQHHLSVDASIRTKRLIAKCNVLSFRTIARSQTPGIVCPNCGRPAYGYMQEVEETMDATAHEHKQANERLKARPQAAWVRIDCQALPHGQEDGGLPIGFLWSWHGRYLCFWCLFCGWCFSCFRCRLVCRNVSRGGVFGWKAAAFNIDIPSCQL